MQILAHRGHWLTPGEKNSRQALQRAFQSGFGVETDVRDFDGTLVVSHDMPGHEALPLSVMFEDYVQAENPGTLALNIKSDGLTDVLQHLLIQHGIKHYFCFDMSVPDTLPYLHRGLNAAARLSEYEPEGMLSELAPVLWVDGFQYQDVSPDRLEEWLGWGKQVCLVSPELHGREHAPFWHKLATLSDILWKYPALMLCTDYPEQAKEYFA
ncbi:hypothetical protein LJPFL01_3465 [Lelliottia jeotgali]|nr:hypothetical protein LJPFL01_3465 [Lelliottia jeotgali]